ncbi:MAG TPA: carboxymuconolactone decarboxylase family protein [Blastocatellia bacterium]|nr:carboxymuconolactone decarboxylase family protein [Blastocatellia bacterium]
MNGCEKCIVSHEQVVTEQGITEDQVQDVIRIAATIYATSVSLEIGDACRQS